MKFGITFFFKKIMLIIPLNDKFKIRIKVVPIKSKKSIEGVVGIRTRGNEGWKVQKTPRTLTIRMFFPDLSARKSFPSSHEPHLRRSHPLLLVLLDAVNVCAGSGSGRPRERTSLWSSGTNAAKLFLQLRAFLLSRPSQDVFLLPLIPWIEQRGSILLVTLLYDL